MKKLIFLLCFCFAFSQEQLIVNLLYSDAKDSQCNANKQQISTILNHRFLQTQNPIFETTYFQKDSPISQHYNLQGNCNLVVSLLKNGEEKTYEVLNLEGLYYPSFLKSNSEIREINDHFLLLGIWSFLFKNKQLFSLINIVFAFWCGFLTAFFYRNANPTSPPLFSLLWLSIFLLIGFILSLILSPSLYPTRKEFSSTISFPIVIMVFLILYTSPKIHNCFFRTPLGNISPLSIFILIIAFLYSNKIEIFLSFALGFILLALLKSDFIFEQKMRNMILKPTALALLCFSSLQCFLSFNLFIGILLTLLQCSLFILALIGAKKIT